MSDKTPKFEDYLHQEYSHIAEAHFKTNETMSTFFKHYLAIMTIPIAVTAYIITNEARSSQPNEIIKYIKPYAGYLLLVISLAGFAVMLHIINLRLDSLLYARTVNGIRKFFYDSADFDINIKLRMRTLPQTTLQPAYFEKSYFLPVIFAFALINTFYLWAGAGIILPYLKSSECIRTFPESIRFMLDISISPLGISFVFFVLHFISYGIFARFRETGYLKSSIIGIDVDGVMNKHRAHFCSLLQQKTEKQIAPNLITHIPVHEADLSVTPGDEYKVFNDPKYWIDMPLEDDTPENLKKLHNIFGFKLFIFTHRPWPNVKAARHEHKKATISSWRTALGIYESLVYKSLPKWSQVRLSFDYILNRVLNHFRSDSLVKRLTILWLRYYGFKYDKLVIEKGNEDTADPRGMFRNRYQFSRRKKIKYFVEDDLEKAVKLAFICDVIFLVDHPYNRRDAFGGSIPSNIVRVKSWNEVYRNIRRLS